MRLAVTLTPGKYHQLLLSWGFCHSGGAQSENKRMLKERQILGPCLRTKKGNIWVWLERSPKA